MLGCNCAQVSDSKIWVPNHPLTQTVYAETDIWTCFWSPSLLLASLVQALKPPPSPFSQHLNRFSCCQTYSLPCQMHTLHTHTHTLCNIIFWFPLSESHIQISYKAVGPIPLFQAHPSLWSSHINYPHKQLTIHGRASSLLAVYLLVQARDALCKTFSLSSFRSSLLTHSFFHVGRELLEGKSLFLLISAISSGSGRGKC